MLALRLRGGNANTIHEEPPQSRFVPTKGFATRGAGKQFSGIETKRVALVLFEYTLNTPEHLKVRLPNLPRRNPRLPFGEELCLSISWGMSY